MFTRKLSAHHERFLKEQKLNPRDFEYMASCMEAFKFFHIPTGKSVWIRR